jgi:glutathione S-transferase
MKTPDFELVSFALCPFVQRSAITLLHKKAPYRTTYIDLARPPEWFRAISPLGKVPLLRVRERIGAPPVVLFESSVINEYIDEVVAPRLLPADPLLRARERAWVEAASELLMKQYQGLLGADPNAFDQLWEILAHVEDALPGGAFFRGEEFSLVDAAFAPFFHRFHLITYFTHHARLRGLPKVRKWSASLLAMPEVKASVVPDFNERYLASLRERGSRFAA